MKKTTTVLIWLLVLVLFFFLSVSFLSEPSVISKFAGMVVIIAFLLCLFGPPCKLLKEFFTD